MTHDPRDPAVVERTPLEIVHDAQTAERFRRDGVADALAREVYGKRTIGDLDPHELAEARYVAMSALRRLNPAWVKKAQTEAETYLVRTLRTDGGRAFAQLAPETLAALATMIAARVMTFYLGILEGSVPVTPADYYQIVQDSEAAR